MSKTALCNDVAEALPAASSVPRAPELHVRMFKKRSSLFISAHNEPLSIVAMRICNPDRSSVGIDG
jgi:hypothetical protein